MEVIPVWSRIAQRSTRSTAVLRRAFSNRQRWNRVARDRSPYYTHSRQDI